MEITSKPGIVIPYRLLLSVYAIIPALLVVVFADTFLFHGWLRAHLPNTPESFVWYMVLFGLPHIMASFFSFADTEYLAYYKDRLLYKLPLVLIAITLAYFYLPTAAILAFVLYTMFHVISQQAGIVLIFAKGKPKFYAVWRWASIIASALTYTAIYYRNLIPEALRSPDTLVLISIGAIALMGALSTYMFLQIRTKEGRIYFFATALSFVIAPFFFVWGYAILAVATLRVVHDLTAFVFYAVHDSNRNQGHPVNFIYRYLPTEKIPIVVFTPALALLIALPFSLYASTLVAFILAFTHYYTEGFVWKRDTPHRKQMAFSTA